LSQSIARQVTGLPSSKSLFAGRSSPLSAKETDQVNEALAKTKLRMGEHFKENQILG